jgi:hypothetical protein
MAASICPHGLLVKNERSNEGKIRGNAGKFDIDKSKCAVHHGLEVYALLKRRQPKSYGANGVLTQ